MTTTTTNLTAILEKLDVSDITPEQIGKCHKVYGPDNKAFYLVENSRGDVDADGNIIEYKVTYSAEYGFQCNCEAGQRGFSNCKSHCYCWHVRAAVACAQEEKLALRELALACMAPLTEEVPAVLIIDGKEADTDTLARVMDAKPVTSKAKAPMSKPFSLLR